MYDLDESRMYYPEDLQALGVSISATGVPVFAKAPMLNSVLQWYSGQMDQNKKTLFEGDICEVGIVNEFGSASKAFAIMRWNEATHQFILRFNLRAIDGDTYKTNSCVLLGNELEHPELLLKVNGSSMQN